MLYKNLIKQLFIDLVEKYFRSVPYIVQVLLYIHITQYYGQSYYLYFLIVRRYKGIEILSLFVVLPTYYCIRTAWRSQSNTCPRFSRGLKYRTLSLSCVALPTVGVLDILFTSFHVFCIFSFQFNAVM